MFATMHMKAADCGMLEYFFNVLSYSFDREITRQPSHTLRSAQENL
jgi:hypothetical protein